MTSEIEGFFETSHKEVDRIDLQKDTPWPEFAFDLRSITYALCGGLGFYLLGAVCLALSRFDSTLASIWLPNASAVALILLARIRGEALLYLALAAGSLAANLMAGNGLAASLVFTAANLTEIFLIVWLVRRTCSPVPDMTDLSQLGQLLLAGGLLGPLASTMVAAFALVPFTDDPVAALSGWFIAASMGTVLVVPAVLLIADAVRRDQDVPNAQMTESLVLMVSGYVAVYLVFKQDVFPLLFLVPPITLLIAFRVGGLGTALYVPGIVLVASWMTYLGIGPIAQYHTTEISKLHVLQAFIAANFLTGLPIAAILSGRARLTDELAEGRRELTLLTESITDAVLRIDRNRFCTYASPSVSDVLGRPREDLIGKPVLGSIHEDARDQLEDLLDCMLEGKRDKERITYRRLHDSDDGRPVFIEADCAVVYDPATGKRDGIVVSARDITARIELETELKSARRKAEDAANAKSEFLANMSHEIRTPMNGVLGFAELLIQGDIDADNRRHAEMIVQSGRAMMLLLNDILDLSKIEAGQVTIDKAAIDPAETIKECLALHRPVAEKKGLALDFHMPERPNGADYLPWLKTDGLRLRQILLNLLGNAIKFTESGRIDVSCMMDEENFAIHVKDTGIGIRPEQLETIFAPFTQGETDTVRRFGGTGLGLTISRQLAELLGGRIEVTSETGKGSTFALILPGDYAQRPERRAAPLEVVPPADVQQGGRVLLVEDHDINRILASEMLERCGQSAAVAHDGNEAIAMVIDSILRNQPYDLVLMDLQMPGCDGFSATRAIRSEGIDAASLPIIALTANAFPEDITEARKAGMQAHLAKPLAFAELARVLERWLPTRIVESENAPMDGGMEPAAKVEQSGYASNTPSGMRPAHSPAMLQRWNARRSEAIEAVRDALKSGAFGEGNTAPERHAYLARLVHKLAGTAAMFGEPELGDQAAAFEHALRSNTPAHIQENLAFELLSVADDPADTLAQVNG